MTLWFLWMTGCAHCAEAKPELLKFQQKHPEVRVVSHDLTMEDWPDDAPVVGPESVPAYALVVPGQRIRTMESRGVLSCDDLERWIFGWIPTTKPSEE